MAKFKEFIKSAFGWFAIAYCGAAIQQFLVWIHSGLGVHDPFGEEIEVDEE